MHSLLTILAVAACGPAEPETDPVEEVSAQGPFPVGYRKFSVSYRPPGAATDRTLGVEAWYPAVAAGEPVATYRVSGIVEKPSAYALNNAAAAAGEFPVAVYSHGSGGLGLLAYPYGERLASHGWLVVAPDHAGNTSNDTLAGTDASLIENMLNRPADITAVLDALETNEEPSLADRADLDRVLLFGHSFGAWTTLATAGGALDLSDWVAACGSSDEPDCALIADPEVRARLENDHVDPRIDVIAPQAPAFVGEFAAGTLAAFDHPTLLMSAELDRTTPHATEALPAWEALDHPDDVWVNLPEGGHYSFITVCDDVGLDLIEAFDPTVVDDGCGPEAPPPTATVGHLASYLLAFAGGHLNERPEWLEVLDVPLAEDLLLQRH